MAEPALEVLSRDEMSGTGNFCRGRCDVSDIWEPDFLAAYHFLFLFAGLSGQTYGRFLVGSWCRPGRPLEGIPKRVTDSVAPAKWLFTHVPPPQDLSQPKVCSQDSSPKIA